MEQTIDTDLTRPLVVVTGATGNLGRQLINSLLNANWRVRGQFRSTIPKRSDVEWVNCDFADPNLPASSLDALVQGADTVINLAAATNNVSEMNVANVTNLDRLAQACVRQGVRYFGQASSMVVYGSPLTRTVDENAPLIELKHPLMSIPDASLKGIETYNIADSNAPTFAQFYKRSGRKTGPHIPFLFDFLKGAKTGKGFSRRLPMGAFRLDDRKLRETGFQHKS
ncbi:hypothetical protein AA0488_1056 [Kozakia baliensis NRIC 0488]|nr:hypothetical protein AA0488_1056 [Kozakia baliensis NRIC 0488]GEL64077.1 hypothetical protein KBA01_13630 [Kozakia baliensis]